MTNNNEMATLTHRDLARFEPTEEQRRMIRATYASGASDAEFAVLMEIARARNLNPLLRQIHFVKRWTPSGDVWAPQVSIDGLRAIAERTGLYAGQDKPVCTYKEDGSLLCCEVAVWRKDWPRPAVGVAYWDEYVQTARDKATGKQKVTAMWARMPHVMLAKCSESIALRKAFPEDAGGLYTDDEMGQADNGREPVEESRREAKPKPAQRPQAAPVDVQAEVDPQLPASTGGAPDPLAAFHAALPGLALPGAAGALWIAHREALATSPHREGAWRALVGRVMDMGGGLSSATAAKNWLKKYIAEHTPKPAGESQERPGLDGEAMTDALAALGTAGDLTALGLVWEALTNDGGDWHRATDAQRTKLEAAKADRERNLRQPPPDGSNGRARSKGNGASAQGGGREGAANDGAPTMQGLRVEFEPEELELRLVTDAASWAQHLADADGYFAVAVGFRKRRAAFRLAGVYEARRAATVAEITRRYTGDEGKASGFLDRVCDGPRPAGTRAA